MDVVLSYHLDIKHVSMTDALSTRVVIGKISLLILKGEQTYLKD